MAQLSQKSRLGRKNWQEERRSRAVLQVHGLPTSTQTGNAFHLPGTEPRPVHTGTQRSLFSQGAPHGKPRPEDPLEAGAATARGDGEGGCARERVCRTPGPEAGASRSSTACIEDWRALSVFLEEAGIDFYNPLNSSRQ